MFALCKYSINCVKKQETRAMTFDIKKIWRDAVFSVFVVETRGVSAEVKIVCYNDMFFGLQIGKASKVALSLWDKQDQRHLCEAVLRMLSEIDVEWSTFVTAPSMFGSNARFIALFSKAARYLFVPFRCILHQQTFWGGGGRQKTWQQYIWAITTSLILFFLGPLRDKSSRFFARNEVQKLWNNNEINVRFPSQCHALFPSVHYLPEISYFL